MSNNFFVEGGSLLIAMRSGVGFACLRVIVSELSKAMLVAQT